MGTGEREGVEYPAQCFGIEDLEITVVPRNTAPAALPLQMSNFGL